jgi:hypothetical protein
MDSQFLVKSDLVSEGLVLHALHRAKIPVTLVDWNYVPQLDEWQLIVATPWQDTRGPHNAYSAVVSALQQFGAYEQVPLRRLFVRSPSDPLVQQLEREARTQTMGSIHISKYASGFSVIFAPYTGPGGAVPARILKTEDNLRDFLSDSVHLHNHHINDAIAELRISSTASIPNVQLTYREAKKLGFVDERKLSSAVRS